jgi:predicted nucleic acid-binding protein
MPTVYLDSSAVLRLVLGQPGRLVVLRDWDAAYSSELLKVETRRAIDRERLNSGGTASTVGEYITALVEIEREIQLVELTGAVLVRASAPLPTVISTLDAIHLATAVLLRESLSANLVFATHDRQQALAAQAMGFDVIGI